MKKIFSSLLSVASAVLLAFGGNSLYSFATAVNTETGVYEGETTEFMFADADEIELNLPSTKILSSTGEDAYLYRDFLDKNNLAVYDALSVLVDPTLDVITVDLPVAVTVTLSALPSSSSYTDEDEEAFKQAVFSNCKAGIDSLDFDTPEIFWLDPTKLGIGIGDTTYTRDMRTKKYTLKINSLKFSPGLYDAFNDSVETAELYKEKLETAVENFSVSGDTRYEQIKSIHDTISLFTYYDLNASYSASAIGSLVEPGVVCEGYSKGFKLICDKLNIPCVCVYGNVNESAGTAHMWNYVLMEDGNWYAVDLTWDDTDGEDGVEFDYSYFMKGSDDFFTNHTEETDFQDTIFTYPTIATYNYTPEGSESGEETTTTITETTTSISTTTTTTNSKTTTLTTSTTVSDTTTTSVTKRHTTTTTTTSRHKTTTTTTTTTTEPETTTTTTTPETTTVPAGLKGDFNNDGVVNVTDLVICQLTVIGRESDYDCDYNEDGYVDSFDVAMMRSLILRELNLT